MMGLIKKEDLNRLTVELSQRKSDVNLFEKVEEYKK